MTFQAFFINNISDLPIFTDYREKIHDKTLAIAHSPELYGTLKSMGLQAEYFPTSPKVGTKYLNTADTIASSISSEIDDIISKITGKKTTSLIYWDLLWLIRNIQAYSDIAESIQHELSPFDKIILATPDSPFDYGRYSFIPAITIATKFLSNNSVATLLKVKTHKDANLKPNISKLSEINSTYKICNFSTCFHDLDRFEAKAKESNVQCIHIDGEKYDPPGISIPRTGMTLNLSTHLEDPLDNFIKKYLNNRLEFLIPHTTYRELQIAKLCELLARKLEFLTDLERLPKNNLPNEIWCCFHENGYTAPLLNFSERFDIETNILPHSKIINYPIHTAARDNLTIWTHKHQSGNITNHQNLELKIKYFDFTSKHESSTLKKVGKHHNLGLQVAVLCNGSSVYGASTINLKNVAETLTLINTQLKNSGGSLYLRHKRNENYTIALDEIANQTFRHSFSDDSLETFLEGIDVCFSIETPTSASLTAIEMEIPTYHICLRDLDFSEDGMISQIKTPRIHSKTDLLSLLKDFERSKSRILHD
jgi:hypothetical protein